MDIKISHRTEEECKYNVSIEKKAKIKVVLLITFFKYLFYNARVFVKILIMKHLNGFRQRDQHLD